MDRNEFDAKEPCHAPSHLERIDQLRAGQHPREALQRGVAQDGALQPDRQPQRHPHQAAAGVGRRRHRGARTSRSSRATSSTRATYVVITDDELAALDPEAQPHRSTSRSSSTWSTSTRSTTTAPTTWPPTRPPKPYALLAEAMERAEQGRHRPVRDAHEAVPGRHPAERRQAAAVDDGLRRRGQRPGGDPRARRASTASSSPTKELAMAAPAGRLAVRRASMPTKFHDTYREGCSSSSTRKAAGRGGRDRRTAAPTAAEVIDLMAALEASVAAAKQARTRHPTARPMEADDETAETSAARRPLQDVRPEAGKKSARRRRPPRRRPSGAGQEGPGEGGTHPEVGLAPRPWRRRRPRSRSTATSSSCQQPRQGALPRDGVHQGRGDRLLRPHRPDHAAATWRPVRDPAALPERGRRRRRSSRSGARRTGRTSSRWRPGPATATGAIEYCGSTIGPPWSGRPTWPRSSCTRPWPGPTTSRPRPWWCSTSTREPRPPSPSARRWRSTSATCSTGSAWSCSPRRPAPRACSSTCR